MNGRLSFLNDVELLKLIDRAGYRYHGIKDPESVAEHSFGVVWYALLIAHEEKADRYKTIKMALLHDLAEAKIGDITEPAVERYLGKVKKREMEDKAFLDVVEALPQDLRSEFENLYHELQQGESLEAHVVHDADKLQMLGQVLHYEDLYDVHMETFWQSVEDLDLLDSSRALLTDLQRSRKHS